MCALVFNEKFNFELMNSFKTKWESFLEAQTYSPDLLNLAAFEVVDDLLSSEEEDIALPQHEIVVTNNE